MMDPAAQSPVLFEYKGTQQEWQQIGTLCQQAMAAGKPLTVFGRSADLQKLTIQSLIASTSIIGIDHPQLQVGFPALLFAFRLYSHLAGLLELRKSHKNDRKRGKETLSVPTHFTQADIDDFLRRIRPSSATPPQDGRN